MATPGSASFTSAITDVALTGGMCQNGAMQESFVISPQSALLTPEARGLAALVQALRHGGALHLSQAAGPLAMDGPPMLFCETSGSSGAPKVIRRRPESWQRSFEVTAGLFGLGPAARYACFGDLGHSLTLYALLEAFHLGADVAALAGMRPRAQAQYLATARISVIYATPTQLRLLLRGAEAAGIAEFPALRHIFCGGGALDSVLQGQLRARFETADLRVFFGASETSFITMSEAGTPAGSVGRAYPGVDLRIDAPAGETGEIWVASPYLFDGYASGAAADTRRAGRWLSIGEMGRLDPAGHLFLRGRKSRMVTVADHNVFPEEIEAVVAQVPGVSACAVVPRLDAARGHRMVCFLQGPAEETALRAACRAALPPQAVPQRFIRIDALPLLPAGKPDLAALARRAEA